LHCASDAQDQGGGGSNSGKPSAGSAEANKEKKKKKKKKKKKNDKGQSKDEKHPPNKYKHGKWLSTAGCLQSNRGTCNVSR
jgi:hypothetical protein